MSEQYFHEISVSGFLCEMLFLRHISVLPRMEFPTLGRNTRIQQQCVYACMTAEIVNTRMIVKL